MSGANYNIIDRKAIPTEDLVPVYTLDDFPAAVSGIITLEAKEYVLENSISIGTNQFALPAVGFVTISGRNLVNYVLSYTGTDSMFKDLTATGNLILRKIIISAPNGALFNLDGNGTNLLVIQNSLVNNVDDLGTIKDFGTRTFNFVNFSDWGQGLKFTGSGGFNFVSGGISGGKNQAGAVMITADGVISSFGISNFLLVTASANESIFDFKSSATYTIGGIMTNCIMSTANGGDVFASGSLEQNGDNFNFCSNLGLECTGELSYPMKETTTPTAIDSIGRIYTKSNNKLYFQDGAGTEEIVRIDAEEGWTGTQRVVDLIGPNGQDSIMVYWHDLVFTDGILTSQTASGSYEVETDT